MSSLLHILVNIQANVSDSETTGLLENYIVHSCSKRSASVEDGQGVCQFAKLCRPRQLPSCHSAICQGPKVFFPVHYRDGDGSRRPFLMIYPQLRHLPPTPTPSLSPTLYLPSLVLSLETIALVIHHVLSRSSPVAQFRGGQQLVPPPHRPARHLARPDLLAPGRLRHHGRTSFSLFTRSFVALLSTTHATAFLGSSLVDGDPRRTPLWRTSATPCLRTRPPFCSIKVRSHSLYESSYNPRLAQSARRSFMSYASDPSHEPSARGCSDATVFFYPERRTGVGPKLVSPVGPS